ncbi:selenoprotein W2 [Penaeus vannamei]|uniref:Selenoprotein W2 n=1 Tax=Penaeus vannamei TaxID=6689 RepID=A0A3R7PJ90_PENVA|nr:selenoprotein W2 [Penaeus vannamei]
MRVRPRYEELARVIRSKVPQAEVVGAVGRRTSFEVSIDGTLIHSKIQTMSFPDFDEVADIVSSVDSGEAVRQLTAVTKANSTIQEENVALTRRIQEEREAVVRLRVQLQQAHKSIPHHPPVPPVC